ncbi:glycosyl hydrolase [Dyadobacter sp. LHD-138]|uniref:glycosyl hydrolase n=1 Tax=Dyadobacter sp. LHD-138 TaxID=3071413 RepID=UPI0027E1F786|nr:glycosyl hydrolase [Dyadobacter sp. LHD-138]MDQ6478837.1 glycosyl hydrolase [Dyadobacter sp. LHD-138]
MRSIILFLLLICSLSGNGQSISTSKPWTYWWWMGSAVNKEDITAQLEQFSRSGLGGVHIIPIYGVKGDENEFVPFLTDHWLDVMQHTVMEGKRLGLGVDMTTGTGWPFGGPNVTKQMAAKTISFKDGKWIIVPTKQEVKRAAPGGEGLVFDPFHPTAMSTYLNRFDSAFVHARQRPRSMYMDSYEAYGANWTDDFLREFKKRRGYDLANEPAMLTDTTGKPGSILVKIDYHQTLAELLRERYAHVWTKWSREKGFLTRYQAHGSPGNLLDLYDEADIPETESFGTSRFPIPGLRIDPDYSIKQFGTPNPLAMKFASSAAHFSGKKLVSSETGTWLANHFKVSLSQLKPQIDELLTAGINHIFYHGTTYSPVKESYPGWLFYASTNFGGSSHFAEHFSLLNQYVERCQKLLQESRPDHDVLVYFPIHDLWSTPAKSGGGVHLLEVHHVDRWLLQLPFGQLTTKLWQEGYAFDYVSDRQLTRLSVDQAGNLASEGSTYKTIIIPPSTYMPEETLQALERLAKAGARIVFADHLPQKVTGYNLNENRQKQFTTGLAALKSNHPKVLVGKDWQAALRKQGVVQEPWAKQGLTFIRKIENGKTLYFVANVGNTFREGWIGPGKFKGNVERYDALSDQSITLAGRKEKGENQIFLTLLPGQSCFLRESDRSAESAVSSVGEKQYPLSGTWHVNFIKGKPSLPAPAQLSKPGSWVTFSDTARYFSGTARYALEFDVPSELLGSKAITLDLGDVREVAAVKINGREIGTAWSIPFQLRLISEMLRERGNKLEIEVTNLSANYMRLRDKQAPDWKKFYDINIVDITYKKFNAENWEPMPSGLLGLVRFLYY